MAQIGEKPLPIFIVGVQPPPMHGMSLVNSMMRERIQSRTQNAVVLDLSPSSLSRKWFSRAGRLPKVMTQLWRFVSYPRTSRPLYISISGGLGQMYEILFIAAARMSRMRCFLHHHSYAYVDLPSALMRVLVSVAGPDAVHICLTDGMADRLRRSYGAIGKTVVMSNLAILPWPASRDLRPRKSLQTIGFLGNIASEKGIYDFLKVADEIGRREHPIRFKIAGPFQDIETERRVSVALKSLHNVEYVGPKYGAEKEDFFKELDVLLFPTRYANEAEPLTLHEAMMHAVPVIAFDRGSISEIVLPESGLVIPTSQDFVEKAIERIALWLSNPGRLMEASTAAAQRSASLRTASLSGCNALLDDLCGDTSAKH